MSTLKTNNVQVGQSGTATNNFTLYQPSTPDGTVRLGVGNTGATTGDAIMVSNNKEVCIGTTDNSVYDAVAAARPLVVQSASSSTTLNASTNSITICNSNTTTSNSSQINFAAITGASGSQFSSAIISAVHGPRTNGQYPTGQLSFSTSTALNNAPSEKFRIAADGQQSSVIPGNSTLYAQYGCRSWVNFNGTGTVAIRASGNVSSITDNGVGDYTVNFTNAMPDANYSVSSGCGNDNTDDRIISPTFFNSAPTTSSFRTRTTNNAGTNLDVSRITLQIIR